MPNIRDIVNMYLIDDDNFQKKSNELQIILDNANASPLPSLDIHIKMNISLYKNSIEYRSNPEVRMYVDYIDSMDINDII